MTTTHRTQPQTRRRARIRAKISGTPERPRLAVFKSNRAMYAQLIDDTAGRTLAAASVPAAGRGARAAAEKAGADIAAQAKSAGIERVVFDRGGFRYIGAVRALAEAARAGGLQF